MLLRPVRGRGDAPGKAVQDVPGGGLPRWIVYRDLLQRQRYRLGFATVHLGAQ